MLEGTKKLFPNDFEDLVEDMLCAAEADELPVVLQCDNPMNFTVKDLSDLFYDFYKCTSLDMQGHLFRCPECGRMHLDLQIDWPTEADDITVN